MQILSTWADLGFGAAATMTLPLTESLKILHTIFFFFCSSFSCIYRTTAEGDFMHARPGWCDVHCSWVGGQKNLDKMLVSLSSRSCFLSPQAWWMLVSIWVPMHLLPFSSALQLGLRPQMDHLYLAKVSLTQGCLYFWSQGSFEALLLYLFQNRPLTFDWCLENSIFSLLFAASVFCFFVIVTWQISWRYQPHLAVTNSQVTVETNLKKEVFFLPERAWECANSCHSAAAAALRSLCPQQVACIWQLIGGSLSPALFLSLLSSLNSALDSDESVCRAPYNLQTINIHVFFFCSALPLGLHMLQVRSEEELLSLFPLCNVLQNQLVHTKCSMSSWASHWALRDSLQCFASTRRLWTDTTTSSSSLPVFDLHGFFFSLPAQWKAAHDDMRVNTASTLKAQLLLYTHPVTVTQSQFEMRFFKTDL